MPTARTALSTLELLAGAAAVLWSLAQVHTALAVGVAGAALVAFNLRRRRHQEPTA
jgi:hypothetical protein